jgi:hopene-associated glycosyltransferase HpnB
LSLLTGLYLVFLRAGFWRADQQFDPDGSEPGHWPDVAILIATRNDAEAIAETLPDLLRQSYPGRFHVFLVDDRSRDGTVDAVMNAAAAAGAAERLSVATVGAPPRGWSRRAWALAQVHEHAAANMPTVGYFLVTEPWVQHEPLSLRSLVAKAAADHCDLVSLLPYSTCETIRDRLLAPCFAFIFQAFHPFRRVNDPKHLAAAASPSCLLVDANALKAAGGFVAVKDAAALEHALAGAVKAAAHRRGHGIWLGLGENSTLVRPGDGWRFLRRLIVSSVATPFGVSASRLAASTIVVALSCVAPPVICVWALIAGLFLDIDQFLITFAAFLVAGVAWAGMAFAAWPTFRLYEQEEWRTLLVPLGALGYLLLTVALVPRLLCAALRSGRKPFADAKEALRARSGDAKVEPHF